MRRFFQVAWLVMRKDLRVETRSWEMVSTTLFFAVSCVLVFSFAFVRGGRAIEGAASGILWIAVAFSGTLALGRAFERERYQDAMRALLMAPVERSAIYLGKLLGIVLLMATVEVVVVVAIAFTFGAPLFAYPGYLAALLAAGTVGFATVGTLFAAMLLRTRTRGVLLPILLYPVTFPVLIAGVGGTVALMGADPNLDLARFWVALLLFFDAVFLTLALWTFEPVMTE
jgi:heme exporter protein B